MTRKRQLMRLPAPPQQPKPWRFPELEKLATKSKRIFRLSSKVEHGSRYCSPEKVRALLNRELIDDIRFNRAKRNSLCSCALCVGKRYFCSGKVLLTDLKPQLINVLSAHHSNMWRKGVGMHFTCPCGCGHTLTLGFLNPLDNKPAIPKISQKAWYCTGQDFGSMTISPAISAQVAGSICSWQGSIERGVVYSYG